MSTVDSHLKALLALSGNEQLAGTRRHLIRGISDGELLEILKKGIGREFARGGLEDVVSVLLDVIARDPASVERSETTGSPAASFKNEQAQMSSIQQQPANNIIWVNDLTAGKRATSASPRFDIRKRSKPNERIVSATTTPNEDRASTEPIVDPQVPTKKISLFCSTEQVTPDCTVPSVDVVYWNPSMRTLGHSLIFGNYITRSQDFYYSFGHDGNVSLKLIISERFEQDYLSKKKHIADWARYLRLRMNHVGDKACVNNYIIRRQSSDCRYTVGDIETACDSCIGTRRLCCRFVMINETIKLAFFPLPRQYRADADVNSLSYWVYS